MSGGVDSSVAAALLVEQRYDVIGVMLRLWAEERSVPSSGQPLMPDATSQLLQAHTSLRAPFAKQSPPRREIASAQTTGRAMTPQEASSEQQTTTNKCCSLESIYDAQSVADRLGIPFYVINAEQPFKTHVVDFFIAEYGAGRTPNPCLACNRKIRFGYLLDYARTLGARYLATGHYGRVRRDAQGRFQLWRGADREKDQSYVLSVLGQADLAQTLFPVGEFTKPQVRTLAVARGLPTASRVDSQDLCFVADGDYRRFLADHAPETMRSGPILDRAGRQLGSHRGLSCYTIGQRSGLGVAAPQPLYVLELDQTRNAVIVGAVSELGHAWLRTGPMSWVADEPPAGPIQAEVQIRYRAIPAPALVTPCADGGAEARFSAPLRAITPGQVAVFYVGEICLGGGIIVAVGQ
jgi:tRNA-specific 2-thiouridylase